MERPRPRSAGARAPLRYRDRPLRHQILLTVLPLVSLSIVAVGIVAYTVFARSQEDQVREFSAHLLRLVNRNVDDAIRNFERVSLIPFSDSTVQAALRREGPFSESEQLALRGSVDQALYLMMNIGTDIRGIFIEADNGGYYYRTSYVPQSEYRIRDQPFYAELVAQGGRRILVSTRDIEYRQRKVERVFSIARLIRDTEGFGRLGAMQVDASVSILEDICEGTGLGDDGIVSIVDADGNLLYSTASESASGLDEEAKSLNAAFVGRSGSIVGRYKGYSSMVVGDTSAETEWTAVGIIPMVALTKAFRVAATMLVIAWLAIAAMAIAAAFFLSRGIVAPLISLGSAMRAIEEGRFEGLPGLDRGDEVGELGRVFSRMSARIDELINTVHRAEIERRDAELLALQSRINPHFLYNTLDSIRAMALEGEAAGVAETVRMLGRLFKYGLSGETETATIEEELDNVRSYLAIQEKRFKGRIASSILVPESLSGALIPRLTLQPLVENAIVHGLEPLERPGRIRISAIEEGDRVRISVGDDGIGLPDSRLEELNALLEEGRRGGKGSSTEAFAISNVNSRIKIIFGKEFGLSMRRSAEGGVESAILIPRQASDGKLTDSR